MKAVEATRETFGWQSAETDWHKVIADPSIDIIDIVTPNDTHCEMAIAAARASQRCSFSEASMVRRSASSSSALT